MPLRRWKIMKMIKKKLFKLYLKILKNLLINGNHNLSINYFAEKFGNIK